ncbi:hypothetical protein K431DRAFT_143893 [Polychaeton citri CBS 116435]|uniref:Uncharacterized protein n=1 Tax=Polychaeton citri CBS 116435 TaxID=1314669 RepID=A0A9P4Q1W8_9PEZI|nr:hypothetical protein K431DRAFT_143893 [Polychaeton citri CBS 116435]
MFDQHQEPTSPTLSVTTTGSTTTTATMATPGTTAESSATAAVPEETAMSITGSESGETYFIIDSASNHPLTIREKVPQDELSGVFLGHDGYGGIIARVTRRRSHESFTVRPHRAGGFLLLSPHWWDQLKVICVKEDGVNLERRDVGVTRWHFARVGS